MTQTIGVPFITPMVRSISAGIKTNTLRPMYELRKPRLTASYDRRFHPPITSDVGTVWTLGRWRNLKAGDRLYVREAYRVDRQFDHLSPAQLPHDVHVRREAEKHDEEWGPDRPTAPGRYRHARFMPAWMARLFLNVAVVVPMRLQDIDRTRCLAEGIFSCTIGYQWMGAPQEHIYSTPQLAFRALWESIHGGGPYSWDRNPAVYSVSFELEERRSPTT